MHYYHLFSYNMSQQEANNSPQPAKKLEEGNKRSMTMPLTTQMSIRNQHWKPQTFQTLLWKYPWKPPGEMAQSEPPNSDPNHNPNPKMVGMTRFGMK